MKKMSLVAARGMIIFFILFSISKDLAAQFDHQQDIVYGYKDGMALVLDAYIPDGNKNGASVICVMSGGMRSGPYMSHYAFYDPVIEGLIESGFVVFAVAHGSQPRYTIEEIRKDISRSVRFIRHNADNYEIDSQKIGIMGRSSGAQLALMASLGPLSPDPVSWDTIEHESSLLQAVVAYYPGTDLNNFGKENITILEHFQSIGLLIDAAFDFHQWDTLTNRFERIEDPELIRQIYAENSPLTHVSEDDPPVLLYHGDADNAVPIQQSELLVTQLKKVGVKHKLIIAKDKGHGWEDPLEDELLNIISWYNIHLLGIEK
jgi:acetyl esterase/lipase